MIAIKKILLTVVALAVLLVAVSFILPAGVHVERSLVMNAGPDVIFSQLNDLRNWENWSPWHKMDTNMIIIYQGITKGKGAKYSWESKKAGKGNLEIIESVPFTSIITHLQLDGMGNSISSYTLEKLDNGTKVTWALDSKGEGVHWLWYVPSKYFNLMMDKMIDPDFEKGLENLDSVAHSKS